MATLGAQRLAAVQASVVNQVAIPCRHGYAVADHCLEIAQSPLAASDAINRVR
jgi:hypothetical protein